MSDRTGVGLVECVVLEAIDSLGARADRGWIKNSRVLTTVEDRIGLTPGYSYDVLLDLARPWTMPLNLISGQGNFGSRGDPAANPPYTESRLSAIGQVALAAERGDIAPVPIGLVNGTVYGKGTRPPFRPQAVIDALRLIVAQPAVSSRELIDRVGPPYFMNDCLVTGDFAALAAGLPTVLRLEARISVSEDHKTVRIKNLPPNVSPDEAVRSLASRVELRAWATEHPRLHQRVHLPLRDIRDESGERSGDLIVCVPERGATPEQLLEQLRDVYGVYSTVPVALPGPLPDLLRSWAETYAAEELLSSLAVLADAIRGQPPHG